MPLIICLVRQAKGFPGKPLTARRTARSCRSKKPLPTNSINIDVANAHRIRRDNGILHLDALPDEPTVPNRKIQNSAHHDFGGRILFQTML
jgi:hypothetical protein